MRDTFWQYSSRQGWQTSLLAKLSRLAPQKHLVLPQVPETLFGHFFLSQIRCNVHSTRQLPHKKPLLYSTSTRRISYRVFSLAPFADALHEQNVIELKECCSVAKTRLLAENSILQWMNFKPPRTVPTGAIATNLNLTRGRVTRQVWKSVRTKGVKREKSSWFGGRTFSRLQSKGN